MCSVDGCTKQKRTRGMCNAHYERWRLHGDVGSATLKPWGIKDCQVDGCEEPHRSNGYCLMHQRRWAKHGDPHIVKRTPGSPRPKALNPAWKGDDAGYGAAHRRVRANRGRATSHACAHCDRQAANWAYDHADPNERKGDDGHGNVMAYSLDSAHYIALCVSCHRIFDARQPKPVTIW